MIETGSDLDLLAMQSSRKDHSRCQEREALNSPANYNTYELLLQYQHGKISIKVQERWHSDVSVSGNQQFSRLKAHSREGNHDQYWNTSQLPRVRKVVDLSYKTMIFLDQHDPLPHPNLIFLPTDNYNYHPSSKKLSLQQIDTITESYNWIQCGDKHDMGNTARANHLHQDSLIYCSGNMVEEGAERMQETGSRMSSV